jgi:transcription elongation factor SPT4
MSQPQEEPTKPTSQIPTGIKKLRACVHCKLLKTEEQFKKEGCENCNSDNTINAMNYLDHTTTNFEGVIALMQPSVSWVAKWNSIVKYIPGLYAISVSGQTPDSDKLD